jgi:transcription elongation GreA/GreB family factor
MSRAFVKEPEGEQAEPDLPERPQSEHPNYITTSGLENLKTQCKEMIYQHESLKAKDEELSIKHELKSLEAEVRYLKKRIECAIPIDVKNQPDNDIRFGATVTLVDENNNQHSFMIVGEDEVSIEKNRISWVSPLPRELIGKFIGDMVIWHRPEGEIELEVLSFEYLEQDT